MNDETGCVQETLRCLEQFQDCFGQGLGRLESELSQFRTDIMAQLDQFEAQVDAIHDRLRERLDRRRAREHELDDKFRVAARRRTRLKAMDAELKAWLSDT